MVVPLSLRGSTALCYQAVVPPLGSTTVSGFCFFHFFAEVGTDVSSPWLGDFCLAVVPHGGAVVPRLRKYRPQFLRVRSDLVVAGVVAVPRASTVVLRVPAVVPLARRGSTAGRRLVGG